jgi:alkylation response protein AidB-like acyl-CoA dehydrogenase
VHGVYAKLEAMRGLLYTATRRCNTNDRTALAAAMCKGWICDTAFDVTNRVLQLRGGSGMMDLSGENRYMRGARTKMIAEGAYEMHSDLIACGLFDKPEFG